jgi:ribose transport system ATP-binding protein
MKEEIYRLEYLDVKYQNILPFQDLSLELYKGERLGFLTKKDQEIDCLIQLLQGDLTPVTGRILYKDKPLSQFDFKQKPPLMVIDRNYQLIEDFSVSENIFLFRRGFKKIIVPTKKMEKQAELILKQLKLPLTPTKAVKELNTFQKIILLIAKAYILHIPVVILKNPGTILSDADLQQLVPYLQQFTEKGVSFIIPASSETVLKQLSSRIVIIHKGHVLWSYKEKDFTEEFFLRSSQQKESLILPPVSEIEENNEVICLENVKIENVSYLNLSLKRGEILGIMDPDGRTIDNLRKLILGELPLLRGTVKIGKNKISSLSIPILMSRGGAFICEDSPNRQLFPDFTALDNLCFSLSWKIPALWSKPHYRKFILKEYSAYFQENELFLPLEKLSSESLQRLIYLRWYIISPDFLILYKPFSSSDRMLEEVIIDMLRLFLKKQTGLLILTANEWEMSYLASKLPVRIQRIPPFP